MEDSESIAFDSCPISRLKNYSNLQSTAYRLGKYEGLGGQLHPEGLPRAIPCRGFYDTYDNCINDSHKHCTATVA